MLEFQLERLHEKAVLPSRGTSLSLGLDLRALSLTEDGRPNKIIVPPRTTRLIHTGWGIKPPQPRPELDDQHLVWLPAVCSRSGLASKSIFVANSPGVIDPDYRGEIFVLLYNGGHDTYYVSHEDKIAQLVAIQCQMTGIVEIVIDDTTDRGVGALGSTDKKQ
jgi:dUTP pyrophosphatase